jgi:DNA-binding transcriptional ArsR family regulator
MMVMSITMPEAVLPLPPTSPDIDPGVEDGVVAYEVPDQATPVLDVKALSKLFSALGNEIRMDIVDFVAAGPNTVQNISIELELSQSQASKHLRILRDAGVVTSQQDATLRIYSLQEPVKTMLAAASAILTANRLINPL